MSTEEQSRLGASRLAPRGDVSALMEPGHFVQFYEDEVFLLDEVSRFIGTRSANVSLEEGAVVGEFGL